MLCLQWRDDLGDLQQLLCGDDKFTVRHKWRSKQPCFVSDWTFGADSVVFLSGGDIGRVTMVRADHSDHTSLLSQWELAELENRDLIRLQVSQVAELEIAFMETYTIRFHEQQVFDKLARTSLFYLVATLTRNQIVEW